jgi:hypothetical protein
MKLKSPASGNSYVHNHVEREVKTTRLKGKSQAPCCRSPVQITEQLAFEFDMPNCSNAPQPSTSRASSQTKPNT